MRVQRRYRSPIGRRQRRSGACEPPSSPARAPLRPTRSPGRCTPRPVLVRRRSAGGRPEQDAVRHIGHAEGGAGDEQRSVRTPGGRSPVEQTSSRHDHQSQPDRDRHPTCARSSWRAKVLVREEEEDIVRAIARRLETVEVPDRVANKGAGKTEGDRHDISGGDERPYGRSAERPARSRDEVQDDRRQQRRDDHRHAPHQGGDRPADPVRSEPDDAGEDRQRNPARWSLERGARSPLPSSAIPAVTAAAAAAADVDGWVKGDPSSRMGSQPTATMLAIPLAGSANKGCHRATPPIVSPPVSVASPSGRLIVDNTNGVDPRWSCGHRCAVIRSSYGRAAGPSVMRGDGSWNAPPEELRARCSSWPSSSARARRAAAAQTRPSALATRPAVVQRRS